MDKNRIMIMAAIAATVVNALLSGLIAVYPRIYPVRHLFLCLNPPCDPAQTTRELTASQVHGEVIAVIMFVVIELGIVTWLLVKRQRATS
jgi:hypothetical protein